MSRNLLLAWLLVIVPGLPGPVAISRAAESETELLAAARVHWQKGRLDESLAAYKELLPSHLEAAAIGQSHCLVARGDWTDAKKVLQNGLQTQPGSAPLWARLAEVQFARGQFDETRQSVAKALSIDADFPAARLVQADLFAATGKLAEADEAYRWFVRYYNQRQPADADTLLIVARGAAQYARWHASSQIFDFVVNTLCPDALANDRNAWQSHFAAGSLLLEKYNRPQAMVEFRKALAINPRAADVLAALAGAALQERELADAEKFAKRALQINAACLPALLVLSDLKIDEGDFRAARNVLDKALEINPHSENSLARAALCDMVEDGLPSMKDLEELFENLDHIDAAALSPRDRFSERTIALARRNPHPGMFLNLVGERLESRRQFLLAERFYRQALRSMPRLSEPKTNLGMLYMRIGRMEDARTLLDQAFDSDPYHVRVSNMRKVLKLLDSYEALASEHFVIRVDSQADRLLGKYALEYLEEQYPTLVEQFGFEPPTRTQFEIYNKSKGLSAHQWFSARMVGVPWIQTIGASTGMIVALASPNASDKPFNWARVLKHEFVHILTLQKTNFNIPHWFTEALAVTAEGYPRPAAWDQLLANRVPRGALMTLDTVNLGFQRPKTPSDWQMAYCQSQLYVAYMIEKFEPDTPRKLLDAYQNNLTTEQAISRVFGVGKEQFEAGYREYLNRLVTQLQTVGTEEPLTAVEIEKAYRESPEDPTAAGRFARLLLNAGKRKEAREIATHANQARPAEPLPALALAELEMRSEDFDAAARLLEPALSRDHPHPQVIDLLSQIRQKQGMVSDAAALYELGLQFNASELNWLRGLAAARLKLGQTEPLRAALKKLSEVDADNAAVRRKLAELALADRSWTDVVHYAKLALHIDVMDTETHRLLARGYAGLGRHDKAIEEWSVALELDPEHVETEVELARAEATAGQKAKAIQRLESLLERFSNVESAKKLLRELTTKS